MMKSSMNQIETNDVNDDPEVSRVERSSSRQSPDHAFPGQGTTRRAPLAAGQRWSVARKREVVLGLLRGESSELLSREFGVPIYRLEQWRQKADAALDDALKERAGDPAAGELAAAMQRIGELSMEVELLRSRIERPGPLARRRSR